MATTAIHGTRDLVKGLRNGDEGAFAEDYDRHSRMIYGILLQMTRDAAIAEDLLQETFLKLWTSAATIDESVPSLAPWLATVARHAAVNYFRAHHREAEVELLETIDKTGYPAPERGLIDEERTRRLRGGLNRLDQHHRNVLRLAYFEGFTQSEMAATMKSPLGTVKGRVRLALSSLRDILSEQYPELNRAS